MKAEMKKAVIENVEAAPKTAKLPTGPGSVIQTAEEFLAFRAELERIGAKMNKLKKVLREELEKVDGNQVAVGEEVVYLCEVSDARSFDLESAEEILSAADAKALKPYIKVERSFSLAAAEEHLSDKEMKRIQKFIKSTPQTAQIRVKKLKESEE